MPAQKHRHMKGLGEHVQVFVVISCQHLHQRHIIVFAVQGQSLGFHNSPFKQKNLQMQIIFLFSSTGFACSFRFQLAANTRLHVKFSFTGLGKGAVAGHLTLEPAQGVIELFVLFDNNFRHADKPPFPSHTNRV